MTAGPRTRNHWPTVAVTFAAVAVVALGGPLVLRGPTFVDRITIVNPSEYDVFVEVSAEGGDGWMSMTTADTASTGQALEVIDQGATWVFRFSAQGRHRGELRLTRTDLQGAGWSVEVPGAVVERIRQQGAPPTP